MAMPSVEHIIDVIIDLIASDTRRDRTELRRELERAGPELPVDSLLAVEVLARIEEQFGVRVPATVESSRNMRSVRRFAAAVYELSLEAEREAGATA